MSAEPESPQIASASDEKARLECEKLKAEIKAINKPLIRTPGFYSAIAPVALAILGLAFSWWSGWFDVQRTRVSNDKTLLEAQTERLKMEQTTLETKALEQQAVFIKAEAEIQALKERESFLTNQLVRLERESTELRSAKDLLENETKRLAGSDAKAKEFLNQLKSLQTTREQEEALIRRANDVLSEGWGIALKDHATWAKFQDFGQHTLEFRVASIPYLPEWQVDPDPALTERAQRAAITNYDLAGILENFRRLKKYEDYFPNSRLLVVTNTLESSRTNQ